MSARRRSKRQARKATKASSGTRRGFFWRWRRVFFVFGIVFVGAVAGTVYVFSQVPLPSKTPPLVQTSFVCAADVTSGCNADNSMATLSGSVDRVDVTYDQIPSVLVDAVVSAEDKNFFRHKGVDPEGVARALWQDVSGSQSEQGGSTITQQYVKTVYLTNERSVVRKIKEAVLAVKLERELPKTEILNRYLNAIYFGRGAYGVEAASKAYFGEDVGRLTLPQAAYLAGLIRSPETADAARPPTDPTAVTALATAKFRRTSVLKAMLRDHYIDRSTYDQAVTAPWTDVLPRNQAANASTVTHTDLGTQYLVDYVRRSLVASGRFTEAELVGGGLRIYTTIDYGLQKDAIDAVTSTLRYPSDPSAALVSIDPSGRIRAMLGGLDYAKSQVNLAVGTAGGGQGRQSGSTFKVFAVAEALKQGMTLNKYLNAPAKVTVPNGNGPNDNWVANNDDKVGYGNINMVTVLTDSVNTYFAQLVTQINPQNLVTMANRMGVASHLNGYPSDVLGTSDVSVLDIASGYSTLMDEGAHITPYIVSRVTDASGRVLYQPSGARTQVITKGSADQISWAMSQVVQRGTGTAAQFDQPAAGKTGTTSDFTDAWFSGFTCKLTASVWMGYPESGQKSMRPQLGDSAFGGGYPAEIWRKFMMAATQGLTGCDFKRPADAAGSVSGGPGRAPTGSSTTLRPGPGRSTTTTAPAGPTTTVPVTVPPTTAAPTTTAPPPPAGPP